MILKISFFKLMFATLKRHTWAIALSAVICLLAIPLPVLIMIQANLPSRVPDMLSQFLVMADNSFIAVLIVVMASIMSISLFAYSHSQKRLDFYHAQPISRRRLFFSNFCAGIMAVLPIYLISTLLAVLIAISFGYGFVIEPLILIAAVLKNIIFFITFYSIGIICTLACGHTFVSILLYAYSLIALPLYAQAFSAYNHLFYLNYANSAGFNDFSFKLSPLFHYFSQSFSFLTAIIYLLLIVALIGLAAFMYSKRPSEAAGTAIAFKQSRIALKYFVLALPALGFGLLFYYLGGYQFLWMVAGLIIGSLLLHWVVEIIYEFDIRSFGNGLKSLAVYGLIMTVVLIVGFFDLTNYQYRLPDEQDIDAVGFDLLQAKNDIPELEGSYYRQEQVKYQSPEIIDAVYELAQNGLEIMRIFEEDGNLEAFGDLSWARVTMYYPNGNSFDRYYPYVQQSYLDSAFYAVYYSDEFTQNLNPLFDTQYLANAKLALIQSTDQFVLDDNRHQQISEQARVEELIAALQADWLDLGLEGMADLQPIGLVYLGIADQNYLPIADGQQVNIIYMDRYSVEYELANDETYGYMPIMQVPIYSQFSRTLALLSDINFDSDLNPQQVKELRLEIYSAQALRFLFGEEYDLGQDIDLRLDQLAGQIIIRDPQIIAALLADAYPERLTNADRINKASLRGLELLATYDLGDDDVYDVVYIYFEDQVPLELLKEQIENKL